jgi:hypothetical protein
MLTEIDAMKEWIEQAVLESGELMQEYITVQTIDIIAEKRV